MLKRLVAGWARSLGYTIIPTWQLSTYAATEDLKRRFASFGIDLVLDVGANDGQFCDLIRQRVSYHGDIVSFEPIPASAARLAARAAHDPRWKVRQEALGSTAGPANFRIMASSQFSSLLAPRHDDVDLFTRENAVVEEVEVQVTTLASVLADPSVQGARAIFLKLDTQGFDLEVLKGAGGMLGRVAAIQAEGAVRQIYQGGAHYSEIVEYLAAHGFVLSGIVPNNEGHFPFLVELDLQFVRSDLCRQTLPHG